MCLLLELRNEVVRKIKLQYFQFTSRNSPFCKNAFCIIFRCVLFFLILKMYDIKLIVWSPFSCFNVKGSQEIEGWKRSDCYYQNFCKIGLRKYATLNPELHLQFYRQSAYTVLAEVAKRNFIIGKRNFPLVSHPVSLWCKNLSALFLLCSNFPVRSIVRYSFHDLSILYITETRHPLEKWGCATSCTGLIITHPAFGNICLYRSKG